MKRLRLVLLSLLLAACAAAIVEYLWEQHTERRQEAIYQAALRSYSAAIRPGSTRRDIETYLRLRAKPFHRQAIEEHSAYADLTKIGEGNHPWYCKRKSIYVAFQFNAVENRPDSTRQSPSDTLKQITLFSQLEGCR
jgi:predicted outer membrane lipoprotein